MEVLWQGVGVACGEVALHVRDLSHARDDRADGRVVEDEPEGHLGHGHPRRHQRLQRMFHNNNLKVLKPHKLPQLWRQHLVPRENRLVPFVR